jgi:Glycosyl transferase family 2
MRRFVAILAAIYVRKMLVRAKVSLDRKLMVSPSTEETGFFDITPPVDADETVYCNARYQGAKPTLSISSPYFRDDPTGWVTTLRSDPRAHEVEIVLVDDGTGDQDLDVRVRAAIDAWPGPAIVIRYHTNKGRSKARNRGVEAARGGYLLFIDADMVPADALYLTRYFEVIDKKAAAIIFGGFTTVGAKVNHDTALNYSLALKNDCKPAAERARRGPLSVASNNLLVRRDVFDVVAFDDGFVGWGWEDTEWAMRAVYAGYGLTHIDNPGIHVGLDTSKAVLRKYKEAGPNLRRLLDRHPEGFKMAGARLALIMARVPFQEILRPICSWVALDKFGIMPLPTRRLATKIWRASYAGEAIKAP